MATREDGGCRPRWSCTDAVEVQHAMTSRSSERKAAAEEIVDGANEEDEIDE